MEIVKATLGAEPHPGASNPTHSFPFTYERIAAQRCQVTQKGSHSTWVAEPSRVQGSWLVAPRPAQNHLGGMLKTTRAQAPTQEILIPQSQVGVGNPGV